MSAQIESCVHDFAIAMGKRSRDRGGIRQRIAARAESSTAEADHAPGRSHLCDYLLGQFFWGLMTAPTVQQVAAAAAKDFARSGVAAPPDVQVLAGLGNRGAFPGKINNEIRSKFLPEKSFPAPARFMLPLLKKPASTIANLAPCFIFLPHVMFSTIFHKFQDQWKKYVCPSVERLGEFWQSQADNPALAGHAVASAGVDYRTSAIPIALHGDFVAMVGLGKRWCKGCDVYSWTSMIGAGGTTERNFLIWAGWASMMSNLFGQRTKRGFWKILNWSLTALQKGYWPRFDHNGRQFVEGTLDRQRAGQPLCGRGSNFYRGVLWGLTSDLDFFRSEYQLPNSSAKYEPCPFCKATGSADAAVGMHMHEYRPGHCRWKNELVTKDEWFSGRGS